MGKAPITKRTVDAAEPAAAEYVIWDHGGKETVKGFGLKVTPAGNKVYIYRYRLADAGQADKTPPRKYTIGKHGTLTPDQARDRAKELAALVNRGIDPLQAERDEREARAKAEKEAEERARLECDLSFENISRRWLEDYELGHRPRSYGQAALAINKHLSPALIGRPLPSITRADLQAIVDSIPARQLATRRTIFAYASIFFGWALQRGYIAENPLQAMAKPKAPKARDRVLSDEELATIWRAAGSLRTPLSQFYRVLMLTGQRREEVAGMDWAELDRATATWTIPASRAKNGVTHLVPLAPMVVEELDRLSLARQLKAEDPEPDAKRWPKGGPVMSIRGGVSLSCFSQAKRLLDAEATKARAEASPLPHWRVHDLRRTLATGFQQIGTRFEVTEAVLNHVSGAKGGVAGIYQRHDWKAEKRDALEAWGRHIAGLLAPADKTNVVAIDAAKKSA